MAVRNDKALDVARFLLRSGARTSIRNKEGDTATDIGGAFFSAVTVLFVSDDWPAICLRQQLCKCSLTGICMGVLTHCVLCSESIPLLLTTQAWLCS